MIRLAEFPRSAPGGSWVTGQGDWEGNTQGFCPPSELEQGEEEGWGRRDSWEG